MKQIVFDVGGKIYKTSKSTIELWPTTLLGMLVRQNNSNEIFIDRDQHMFRWILLWYRTSILVDHMAVGVPEVVWDAELDFYGIGEPEFVEAARNGGDFLGQKELKRRKIQFQEQEIKSEISNIKNENEISEMQQFIDLIKYMIQVYQECNVNNFEFISCRKYPMSIDKRARLSPMQISHCLQMMKETSIRLGVKILTIGYNNFSQKINFKHLPASSIKHRNPCMGPYIHLKILFI